MSRRRGCGAACETRDRGAAITAVPASRWCVMTEVQINELVLDVFFFFLLRAPRWRTNGCAKTPATRCVTSERATGPF